MQRVLQAVAGMVHRRPLSVLAVIAALTIVLGYFAAHVETSAELTEFAPESEAQIAYQRVQDEFAGEQLSVLVIVEAGDGSVLSPAGLQAAAGIEQAVRALDLPAEPAEVAAQPPGGGSSAPASASGVLSFAQPFLAAGIDPATASEAEVEAAVRQVLAEEPRAAMLLSRDFDTERLDASAGLIVVPLGMQASIGAGGGGSTQAQMERAISLSQQVADAVEPAESGGISVTAFNEALLANELQAGVTDELPMLLGASLVLVLLILIFTFRSVSDIFIGMGGLITAVVWTFGISALLGPGYAGLVGPFSQVATAVPVLIVGLGIDYSIHLTSRYREERAGAHLPGVAAARAVVTVGAALVLATATVIVGFLTNIASPMPPLRDFGIFVSAGVLAAFVIFTAGVPAARHALDRRRAPAATVQATGEHRGNGFSALMGRLSVLSEHFALPVLLVAVAVTVLAGVAATQVRTTFEVSDFIPDDSHAGQAIAALERHFGGDLTERTSVLVEGDLADPGVANAMLQVQAQLPGTPFVQQLNGQVASVSPASLVAQVAASLPPEQAAALGWTGEGFAPDARMEELYGLAEQAAGGALAGVLNGERTAALISIPTVAGQEQAEPLRDALESRVQALQQTGVRTTITSENLVLQEALDALTESQVRGIAITLGAALLLLVAYYGLTSRRPVLGIATMLPSLLVTVWALGSMWVLGLSFNVLTVMVSALAIGIGVPYGIHVTNRFLEEMRVRPSLDEAIQRTMAGTGGALAGSAATTAAGFGVLALSSLAPLRQFGIIVAMVILYSLVAATIVEPAILKYWARFRRLAPEERSSPAAGGDLSRTQSTGG